MPSPCRAACPARALLPPWEAGGGGAQGQAAAHLGPGYDLRYSAPAGLGRHVTPFSRDWRPATVAPRHRRLAPRDRRSALRRTAPRAVVPCLGRRSPRCRSAPAPRPAAPAGMRGMRGSPASNSAGTESGLPAAARGATPPHFFEGTNLCINCAAALFMYLTLV